MGEQTAERRQVEVKLAGARMQFAALAAAQDRDAAESYACAAVHQMLQALTAALQQLNALMPDPLPPMRVSRRNLRDRFAAVGAESQVLRELDRVGRPGQGWLWWLERQAAGSSFRSLVQLDPAGQRAVSRDPLDPGAGLEPGGAAAHLTTRLEQMRALVAQIDGLADADAARYRAALRRQNVSPL